MRVLEWVQIAFYVVLALLAILVAAQAIATMRDISHDLRQGQRSHGELLQQSRQALKDHEQMFLEHQAQMRALTR
jgi:hypothetical protein